MRTLGVDLASQAKGTAVCDVAWDGEQGWVERIEIGATDDRILGLAAATDVIGIDAPFGWPAPFIDFIAQLNGTNQARLPAWDVERRDSLRFRFTDVHIRGLVGKAPLSVSSDLIALPAMRCAGLLGQLGVVDRSGDGRVFEVYPGAALKLWGFNTRGYKTEPVDRARLVDDLLQACHPWLMLGERDRALCARSDHALDALVAALVARAAGLGLTIRPDASEQARVAVEGWIAAPTADSLRQLPLADQISSDERSRRDGSM
jgi:predicted nuclease with RNAse H fold